MQPYRPKQYDPGRLRYKIDFYTETTVVTPSGGSPVTEVLSLSTRAAKEKIFEGSQLALEAGASVLNQDVYFLIRKRNAWTPEKNMIVKVDDERYVINAIIPVNEPVTYLKLLCIKNN